MFYEEGGNVVLQKLFEYRKYVLFAVDTIWLGICFGVSWSWCKVSWS
jgi:hypothetical protein